jgi:uncharacterized membrane protein
MDTYTYEILVMVGIVLGVAAGLWKNKSEEN